MVERAAATIPKMEIEKVANAQPGRPLRRRRHRGMAHRREQIAAAAVRAPTTAGFELRVPTATRPALLDAG